MSPGIGAQKLLFRGVNSYSTSWFFLASTVPDALGVGLEARRLCSRCAGRRQLSLDIRGTIAHSQRWHCGRHISRSSPPPPPPLRPYAVWVIGVEIATTAHEKGSYPHHFNAMYPAPLGHSGPPLFDSFVSCRSGVIRIGLPS